MSCGSFVSVFHENYAEDVTKNFKSFLDNDLYIDLVFVCRNNKKVGAHQVVLGCLSKFFYSIFIDNLNAAKEKVIYIYVPDIRAKMMKYILQFIYCGKAMLNKEELNEFNEDIKLLGMPLDLFQPLEDTAANTSKVASTSNSVPNSTHEVPIDTTSPTVDLTVPSTVNLRPLASDLPVSGINESVVSSSNLSIPVVSRTVTMPSESIVTSLTAPIHEENNVSGLPVITSVCALDPGTMKPSTSNNVNILNRLPESTNFSPTSLGNQYSAPCNNTKLLNNTILEPIAQNNDPTSKGLSPIRKRKKSNVSIESNKRIVQACINLDGSDDESDIITIM